MKKQLSHLRAQLKQTQEEIQTLFQRLLDRTSLLPGSLYEMKRKCGKEKCRCNQGKPHVNTVLSYRGKEKPQTITPPTEQIETLRKWTDDYRRFRKARAQLVRLQRQMVELVDQMQELRVQQAEKEFQKMRNASSPRKGS